MVGIFFTEGVFSVVLVHNPAVDIFADAEVEDVDDVDKDVVVEVEVDADEATEG